MTTTDRARALLAGPRGRELCAHVARTLDPAVDEEWSRRACHGGDDPAVAAGFASAMGEIDVTAAAAFDDPVRLIGPLADSVCSAMYWQPPFAHEAILAAEPVRAALEPLAAALAVAPAAAWWFTPADRNRQHFRSFAAVGLSPRPLHLDFAGPLASWATNLRREQVRRWDDALKGSGCWWSSPGHGVPHTSRALNGMGAVGLELVEECTGDYDDATVWPIEVDAAARVYEVATPQDWIALVRAHPIDVSRARRGVWWQATGRDGPWQIPDWSAVADRWDGVHLTVAGYLATAGRALDLGDGVATVLAGFDPDATYWLRDVVRVGATSTRWRRDDDADIAWSHAAAQT